MVEAKPLPLSGQRRAFLVLTFSYLGPACTVIVRYPKSPSLQGRLTKEKERPNTPLRQKKENKGKVHSRGAGTAHPPPRYPHCSRPPPPPETTTQSRQGRPRPRLDPPQEGPSSACGPPWYPPGTPGGPGSPVCLGTGLAPRGP